MLTSVIHINTGISDFCSVAHSPSRHIFFSLYITGVELLVPTYSWFCLNCYLAPAAYVVFLITINAD